MASGAAVAGACASCPAPDDGVGVDGGDPSPPPSAHAAPPTASAVVPPPSSKVRRETKGCPSDRSACRTGRGAGVESGTAPAGIGGWGVPTTCPGTDRDRSGMFWRGEGFGINGNDPAGQTPRSSPMERLDRDRKRTSGDGLQRRDRNERSFTEGKCTHRDTYGHREWVSASAR